MSNSEKKGKPIIFNGDMVLALLDGRKTQTRRIAKPSGKSPSLLDGGWSDSYVLDSGNYEWLMSDFHFGNCGDLLWVRETWYDTLCCREFDKTRDEIVYRADPLPQWEGEQFDIPWRPSIHMPRWASRITLKITGIRVERLHDISEEDALSEGVSYLDIPSNGLDPSKARTWFKGIWSGIYGFRSWQENPWVWVIEFEAIQKNIDDVIREMVDA